MSNTAEIINKVMEEKNERVQKVRSLVSNIDLQLGELNKKLSALTDKYVTQEIAGNNEVLAGIDKDINDTRLSIENLQGKKNAYERLAKDDNQFKDTIPKILECARKDRNERFEKIKEKQGEKEALKLKIEEMENKLLGIDSELYVLNQNKELRLLKPLLKDIEPRKIKIGFEDSYIGVLLSEGTSSEFLEQYLEPTEVYEKPRPTSIMSEVRYHHN
jgi:chromosome segregation ATPase